MRKHGILVLVRHGQSEWNLRQLYTGRADPGLTGQGIAEAKTAGKLLKQAGLHFDIAFASELRRARDTVALMLAELGQQDLPTIRASALNERDFGELTGMNRAQVHERWGKNQLRVWQHSSSSRPPGGESLADIARRVVPYFRSEILPRLQAGQRILAAAHRHSLRAMIAELEGSSMRQARNRDIRTAVPLVYHFTGPGPLEAHQLPDLAENVQTG
jgi:2,3-bisphosphoglycerate-dependent phosphoglycerate mutase